MLSGFQRFDFRIPDRSARPRRGVMLRKIDIADAGTGDLLDRWPPGPFAKEDGSPLIDDEGSRVG
jgi:hypothetical protein